MKAAKSFAPAEELCRKVQELEQLIENKWDVFLFVFLKASLSIVYPTGSQP